MIDAELLKNLQLENKTSLIRIMFNVSFCLEEPEVLSKEFLTLLHEAYKSIEEMDTNNLNDQLRSENEAKEVQR